LIQSDGFKENAENAPQIETLFEQYVKEMRFLRNFCERTLDGYKEVFKWPACSYKEHYPLSRHVTQAGALQISELWLWKVLVASTSHQTTVFKGAVRFLTDPG
jgi:hypothetical protein